MFVYKLRQLFILGSNVYAFSQYDSNIELPSQKLKNLLSVGKLSLVSKHKKL